MTLATDYQDYYKKTYILFELAKAAKGREIALLPNKHNVEGLKEGISVRNIKGWSINYLISNFNAFELYGKNFNIYFSVATFKQDKYPTFSYAVSQRKTQQEEFVNAFVKNPKDFLEAYDIFLDVDAHDFNTGCKQTRAIIEYFKEYNIPVHVNPSGGKEGGFHVRVDYEHFKNYLSPVKMALLGKEIALDLIDLKDVDDLDWKLFDLRRVCKIPYSLVYDGKGWNVVLPLTQEQFSRLSPETYKLPNVSREVTLKERGLCEWTYDKPPNIKKFLADYRYLERIKQ